MREPTPAVPQSDAPSSIETLPALVGRLGEDLATLIDSKLSLLKLELQEDLRSYVWGLIRLGGGVLVTAVGVGLVSAAIALFLSSFLATALDLSPPAAYALGFLLVGMVFVVGGLVVAMRAARQLGAPHVAPARSLEELAKDRDWLRPERP